MSKWLAIGTGRGGVDIRHIAYSEHRGTGYHRMHPDVDDQVSGFGIWYLSLQWIQYRVVPGSETDRSHITNFLQTFQMQKWSILRWPRELNALQLQKTHANRKNTSKLRKQLNQFDNTRAANAHNTTKQRNALPIKCFIWLCCEHLQSVYLLVCVVSICCTCCKTDENVFLIC